MQTWNSGHYLLISVQGYQAVPVRQGLLYQSVEEGTSTGTVCLVLAFSARALQGWTH